ASPYLYRRAARPSHPDDEEGWHGEPDLRVGRSRQDVHGLPRRSVSSVDGSARSGTEPLVYGPLPGCGVRPFESHVCVHGECPTHGSAAAARPHGNPATAGLYGARQAGDCQAVPGEARARSDRPYREETYIYGRRLVAHDPALHARG